MSQKPVRILIADDDEGDRKQMKRALKHAAFPCRVVEATDLDDVIRTCEAQVFDCAILDYLMPGKSGLEGIRILRRTWPGMPILMVSGQGDELIAAEAFRLGVSDYIPKRALNGNSVLRMIENAMERAQLQKKVAEQREALENFANMLVHDLSAPIRLMRGFSGLVARAVENEDYAAVQSYCHRIDAAGQRMQDLIETLNEYNKASGGEIRFARFPLETALRDALANLQIPIGERQAAITVDALPEVYGNAPLLTQLFQNLVGNSLKYCDRPVPEIHIGAETLEDAWCISVTDNGLGIPNEACKAVFNPFKRLHATDDTTYSGTGLGLATCRKIVEHHGGSIWCKPGDFGGTVFQFVLRDKGR